VKIAEPKTTIVHGTDSMTAKTVLAHGFYPQDATLTAKLMTLRNQIAEKECVLLMTHIPGVEMAADAPSRGRPLIPDLCDKSLTHLRAEFARRQGGVRPTVAKPTTSRAPGAQATEKRPRE
jgi:hypothetical protein